MGTVDPAMAPCNFFRAGDLQPLAMLQRSNELARLHQAVVRSRIQPGIAPPHDLDAEQALFQIKPVQVRDFELATWRWLELPGQFHHLAIVEIESRNGIVALGFRGLFFQRQHLAGCIEFSHAIALGVVHVIGENTRSLRARLCVRK